MTAPGATIVIHLPTHRETALKLQGPGRDIEQAYDRNIGGYVDYLREEAGRAGFRVETDQRAYGPVFSIDERDHERKKAAHAWFETLPDIWNWMPQA